MSNRRSTTPAAIAGVIRSDEWISFELHDSGGHTAAAGTSTRE
jgi:hypothetical protein